MQMNILKFAATMLVVGISAVIVFRWVLFWAERGDEREEP